jgi:hypothetical protein
VILGLVLIAVVVVVVVMVVVEVVFAVAVVVEVVEVVEVEPRRWPLLQQRSSRVNVFFFNYAHAFHWGITP